MISTQHCVSKQAGTLSYNKAAALKRFPHFCHAQRNRRRVLDLHLVTIICAHAGAGHRGERVCDNDSSLNNLTKYHMYALARPTSSRPKWRISASASTASSRPQVELQRLQLRVRSATEADVPALAHFFGQVSAFSCRPWDLQQLPSRDRQKTCSYPSLPVSHKTCVQCGRSFSRESTRRL